MKADGSTASMLRWLPRLSTALKTPFPLFRFVFHCLLFVKTFQKIFLYDFSFQQLYFVVTYAGCSHKNPLIIRLCVLPIHPNNEWVQTTALRNTRQTIRLLWRPSASRLCRSQITFPFGKTMVLIIWRLRAVWWIFGTIDVLVAYCRNTYRASLFTCRSLDYLRNPSVCER